MAHLLRDFAEFTETDIDYTTDTVYLFTWNPKTKGVFYDDYPRRWKEMVTILKNFNRCMSKYCIIPEISPACRLHCHGWFVIKDMIKWQKSVFGILQNNGMFKMNKLKHIHGLKYYKKDIENTIQHIPNNWPLTHSNLRLILNDLYFEVWKDKIDKKEETINYNIEKYFMIN